jgi:hypothetical protein
VNDPGQLFIAGIPQAGPVAAYASTGNERATVFQQGRISVAAGTVVQMTAQKFGGTGTSHVQTQSTISALWVSP